VNDLKKIVMPYDAYGNSVYTRYGSFVCKFLTNEEALRVAATLNQICCPKLVESKMMRSLFGRVELK
jgi:hypothetical protein